MKTLYSRRKHESCLYLAARYTGRSFRYMVLLGEYSGEIRLVDKKRKNLNGCGGFQTRVSPSRSIQNLKSLWYKCEIIPQKESARLKVISEMRVNARACYVWINGIKGAKRYNFFLQTDMFLTKRHTISVIISPSQLIMRCHVLFHKMPRYWGSNCENLRLINKQRRVSIWHGIKRRWNFRKEIFCKLKNLYNCAESFGRK